MTHFICDAMGMAVESRSTPQQLGDLFESQIKVAEHEHHEAVGALQKTADAMPGFGIVAAVLGIVITMGAINGPAEEIGHKVVAQFGRRGDGDFHTASLALMSSRSWKCWGRPNPLFRDFGGDRGVREGLRPKDGT
ncbi:MAG: MotA/TolQ/ExbB proton channel family protein [Planctomycetaceae bacterium]